METNLVPKNADFCCLLCDFKCSKKSNYDIHLKTIKHMYRVTGNEMENAEIEKNAVHLCKCGKQFLSYSGLWKHKKKCITEKVNDEDTVLSNEPSDKQLIMMLIKDNNDLRTMMMEVIKNGTHNTTTTTTNSHNKAFNLNFFLNETCKDAMNITDFVESIKLQLSDLERVGELGFVDGISNIIVQNLKDLDITQRPVHCTDKKREVLYVKDENKWEKENEDKTKIRKAIKQIAHKNTKLIPQFKEIHPDCGKSVSKYCDKYNKLIIESFGGSGNEDFENENKIIKKLTREIMIEKEGTIVV
jgi:hypothetical protein